MNKIRIFLAVCALIAAGTLSAQTLSDVNAKYTEAAEAMQGKDFSKAIPLFEQVIDEGMDVEGAAETVSKAKQYLPAALFYRGGGEFQQKNLDAAFNDFARSAELAELYGEVGVLNNARTWLSRTVMQQGADAFNNKDYATAASVFEKGYEANPNETGVALNLAMSYSEMGDYEKGNAVYKNIIALDGQNSRFDDAVAEAKQKFTDYNLARAAEAAQQKDYATAIAATDEIIGVIPSDPRANMLRLQTFNNMKDYNKVIEVGEAVVAAQESDEQRANANFLIGAAHQNKENYAKAVEYYRKVTAGANADAAKAQITELQKLIK